MTLAENGAWVQQSLRQIDPNARTLAPERWALSLMNGSAFDVQVGRCPGWLVIECRPEPMSPFAPERAWALLERSRGFESGAKLLTDERGLALRVDVPTAPTEDGTQQEAPLGLAEACAGLRNAWATLHGQDVHAVPGAGAVDLRKLCADAGWDGAERAAGRMVVELEAPGFWPAELAAEAAGLRATVEVTALDDAPQPVRVATAAFLLEISGLIRLARGCLRPSDGGPRACLEVTLRAGGGHQELARALEALSVSCRLWGNELRGLQDAGVASQWLALRAPGDAREGRDGESDRDRNGDRPRGERRLGPEITGGERPPA